MTGLKVVLIVLGTFLLWQVVIRTFRKLYHFPAPALIGRFLDSNMRRLMQSPAKLIERSGIKAGMKVVDLGCGSGTFTPFIAKAVGEEGAVYAIDIQPEMLQQLERKLAQLEFQDIRNVELRQANAYELPLEDASIDTVFMVTVLQEIKDRGRALREVCRVLKPGGILAVSEFLPDPDYSFRSTTIRQCQQEGLILDDSSGSIWNYTVRLKKPLSGKRYSQSL